VVRDNIQHLADLVRVQRVNETGQPLFPTQFLIGLAVVDDVIPMRASFGGLQVGRAIDVGHAERAEIRDYRRGVIEGEPGMQLQSIRRGRWSHSAVEGTAPMDQLTHCKQAARSPFRRASKPLADAMTDDGRWAHGWTRFAAFVRS
jgi:hypothetical protein